MAFTNARKRRAELKSWRGENPQYITNEERVSQVNSTFEIPSFESVQFKAMMRFLQKPWFVRAWTYQENVHARRWYFYYGESTFPEISLGTCITTLHLLRKATGD
jgi:hypothetical protein